MLKTNQTLSDFQTLIQSTQQDYFSTQLSTDLKYTTFIDLEGETKYCMVANKISATKIIFDEEFQHIITQTIYKSDLDIFNKLRSEL